MHFAAYLDVGESVREPIKYYRNNVVGALSVLEAMAAEVGVRVRVLLDVRDVWRTDRDADPETHPQRPINSYGETKLAIERALPHFEQAYGIHPWRCGTSTPRGRIRKVKSARTTRRKSTSSPARSTPPRADRGLQVFGDDYPTPDGTCLRDYVHVTDLADAHVRALEQVAGPGRSAAYNLGTGVPRSVREVIDAVSPRHRARGAVDAGAPAAGRSGGAVRASRQGARGTRVDAALFRSRCDCRARPGAGTGRIRDGYAGS